MMTTFSKIIEKYGSEAQLYGRDGSEPVKCFIEPVMGRYHTETWKDMTELGERDTSRYYGFFPGDTDLEGYEYVVCGDRAYDMIRAEVYKAEGNVSHWEALLSVREEEYDG